MPPGTDCPYPIWSLAFFEMIRPYHVVIRTANTVIAKVIMYTRLKYHCVVNDATTQNHSKLGLRCVKSLIINAP